MGLKTAVIGAGTWGATLSQVLADNGHDVRVWDINSELIHNLQSSGRHPKLPGSELPAAVKFTTDWDRALEGVNFITVAVPSPAVRVTFERLKQNTSPSLGASGQAPAVPLVVCTKGMDSTRRQTFSQLAAEIFGPGAEAVYCVLSGPTHAEEVVQRMPSAIVAASRRTQTAQLVQEAFSTDYFRVYTQTDVIGVEIGGAVKNIVAIAAGAAEGLGFGDNTRAALLTRGLAEITRLGVAFGASAQTFSGLAGIGDIIVTATSRHSRNRRFGELIARGRTPEAAIAEIGMVVEGYHTVATVNESAHTLGIPMPITQAVHRALYEGASPQQMVAELMMRPLKAEMQETTQ
ncbi:MAG: NAD(P)H-dependent glycerol-3-phosphate dehydrogenase [Candidatus Sumerlaeia bacterium]